MFNLGSVLPTKGSLLPFLRLPTPNNDSANGIASGQARTKSRPTALGNYTVTREELLFLHLLAAVLPRFVTISMTVL